MTKEETVDIGHFVGYADLVDLLTDLLPGQDVYILLSYVTQPTDLIPLEYTRSYLTVSAVNPESPYLIRYWRIRIGEIETMRGAPADPNRPEGRDRLRARGESAEQIVRDLIKSLGFRVVEALMAIPEKLRLLDGSYRFMRYDRETDRFVPMTPGTTEADS
jgi:hypothetical protein